MSIISIEVKGTLNILVVVLLYLQDLLSLRILFINLEYPFQFTYIFLLAGRSIEWIAHVFFLSLLVFNTRIDLLCLRHKSKVIFNLQ